MSSSNPFAVYLAPDFLATLSKHKLDWVSILKHNRNLETNSFRLQDENGDMISFDEPRVQVKDFAPRMGLDLKNLPFAKNAKAQKYGVRKDRVEQF